MQQLDLIGYFFMNFNMLKENFKKIMLDEHIAYCRPE